MKISINLLPEEHKARVRRGLRTRLIFVYGVVTISIPVAVMVVMGSLLMIANLENTTVAEADAELRTQSSMQEMKAMDDLIMETNTRVKRALVMEVEQQRPSQILRTVSAAVPAAMQMDQLSIDQDIMTVRGTAAERSTVIALKDALEETQCFENVVLPLTSLTDRRDTDFTLTAQYIGCP